MSEDLVRFDESRVRSWIGKAETFVEHIGTHLESKES